MYVQAHGVAVKASYYISGASRIMEKRPKPIGEQVPACTTYNWIHTLLTPENGVGERPNVVLANVRKRNGRGPWHIAAQGH